VSAWRISTLINLILLVVWFAFCYFAILFCPFDFCFFVCKVEGKVHPITCHGDADGEYKYRSTPFLTSVLDERGWLTSRFCRFIPANDPVPLLWEARWTPGPLWKGAENFAQAGIRFPDRSVRSESLYRLRHSGLFLCMRVLYVHSYWFFNWPMRSWFSKEMKKIVTNHH
jgi:hypothetical protein